MSVFRVALVRGDAAGDAAFRVAPAAPTPPECRPFVLRDEEDRHQRL
jgi:hypothetical protein